MRLWPLQVCQAHRADGGRVVVVMSQREKLDMESLYRCGDGGAWLAASLPNRLDTHMLMQDALSLG